MVRHDELLWEALQERGYRLTPQRLLIVAVLESREDHVSADEILAEVRRTYPFVNISTVYRTLGLLQELGLVAETDLGGGRLVYHWADKGRHHHLVCEGCGALTELDQGLLEPVSTELEEKYGFRARLEHFAIFGLCRSCRAKED